MSKIAVFVETYTPSMGADTRQVMFVPGDSNAVHVYSRITNGNKGLGNKWEETDLDTVIGDLAVTEKITKTPVGVRMTDNDTSALELKGYAPVLHVKAVNAHLKSTTDNDSTDVTERICDLYQRVASQDASLTAMIIDLRSQRSTTAPFLPEQAVSTQTNATQELDAENDSRQLQPVFNLASVPPIERAQKYISRNLTGFQDFEVYDKARENKIDVLIYGPTGPGKTSSVVAWAAARKLRMATVSGNAALEPSQLIGKYIPDGKGGFMWIDGPVTDVVRNGGVLCLDEVNFISPKIYTVLYSLLDERRALILLDHMGETIEAHPDLTIFATMNPSYVGTTPLNFAFRNRFALQIAWDYDDKVESKLIKSQAIQALAKQLRSDAAKGELETPISTNMLMELEKFITLFNYEFAVKNFIEHFELEEQDKVQLVFTAQQHNIKSDFGLIAPVQEQPEESQGMGEKIVQEAEAWLQNNTPSQP